MDGVTRPTVLKNAHVIDPARALDGPADVLVADGKIVSVGSALAVPPTPRPSI